MVVELGGEFSTLAFFAEGEFGGEGAEFFLVCMDLCFGEFLFGDITDIGQRKHFVQFDKSHMNREGLAVFLFIGPVHFDHLAHGSAVIEFSYMLFQRGINFNVKYSHLQKLILRIPIIITSRFVYRCKFEIIEAAFEDEIW